MPNPSAHIDLALEGAQKLSHPILKDNIGSFILGCTAPDVRVITKKERSETHFSLLNNDIVGTGPEGMFERYPGLKETSGLSGATVAFVAGYIAHLIADEMWITHIYRLYFQEGWLFEDNIGSTIVDRTLQLQLDLMADRAGQGLYHSCTYLVGASVGVEVEFIPENILLEWQEWLIERSQTMFSWERLRFMVQRQYPDAKQDSDIMKRVDKFIRSLPNALEQIFMRLPKEKLYSYREQSVQEWVRLAREYLP